MKLSVISRKIRLKGGRLTKTRKAIVEILFDSGCLLSSSDIISRLKKRKIRPDRSTMYRELIFLAQNDIIVKNTIANKDYFELPKDHHHHLVCVDCNSIQKVIIGDHLQKQEKKIEKESHFQIISHSLDFYGRCRNCQVN